MTQAQRKLLGEIDRVLKKVQEGAKEFEDILRKVNTAASSNQKEKYETDLKKAIKKLQRYRDQIKTWTQSNVIKDKKALVEARKMIEANMEKFKVCEKEMKTKAFSKEGLQQAALAKDEDPNTETKKWIGKCLTKLRSQIDALDTEIEGLAAKKGKRSVEFVDRLERLKVLVKKHHYHEEALEQILRKLDNETVAKEDVDAIRDGVEYYIDSNQEADFYEDEQLYDELNLTHGAGGSLTATPDTSSPNSSNTTPSATPLSSSPPTSSGFPASFASAVASSLPSGGLRSSQVGLKNTRKKGEEDGEEEDGEEVREESASTEVKQETPAAKPERQETAPASAPVAAAPAPTKTGPSHLPMPIPTSSLPIPTPAPVQKKLATSAPPETVKRTARDVLLGSQPSAPQHQPPPAQQPPSQPPALQQQAPALLHHPTPQQQPTASHPHQQHPPQQPALVPTPSQPQQRSAPAPNVPQATQGTSPRRSKASPTPPPEMPSQRTKEEELAARSASAPPYQQHPAHHMPPSMMQQQPSAASAQLPSLMQLSQQMGRQQYMQTLQEAAEDSKNLDTFDNPAPTSSGSLADLSAASASLEMAAAAAARTSPLLCSRSTLAGQC
jgi:CCR4-NOT transcription complex subunit 3